MPAKQKTLKTLYRELERTGKEIQAKQQKEKEIREQLEAALDAEIIRSVRGKYNDDELFNLLLEARAGKAEIAFIPADHREAVGYDDFSE